MHITIANDSSVSGAPSGFQGAVNAAVAFYDRTITNNISLTIHFGYGEVNGTTIAANAAAQSESSGYDLTYAQLIAGIDSAATSQNDLIAIANLPGTDPTGGSAGDFYVAYAQTVALGFNLSPADSFVGLSSTDPFNYDPNNRAVNGEFDAIGAFEHEISENLGRIEELGSPSFTLLDLYRYSSAGVRDLSGGPASFSIDGTHLLQQFNNPQNGGDAGDWIPSLEGDSYGDNYQGAASLVSRVDLEVMDALGYTIKWWFADDFSNSGFSDVVWRNSSTGELDVWNANNFNPNSTYGFAAQSLGAIPTGWTLDAVGDYNGDGKVDLVLRNNSSGEVDVWNSNAGSSVSFTPEKLVVIPTTWTLQQSAADFNGDGYADLVWRNNSTGETDLWTTNGTSSETFGSQNIGVIPTVWAMQEFGDFNNDGRSDVIWRNTSTGEVDAWTSTHNSASVSFNQQSLGIIPTVWALDGTGDFNGNGADGLIWRNTSTGEVDVWSFTGKTSVNFTSQEVAVIPTTWSIVAIGDYNGDGKADILWQNSSGEVDVWLSNAGTGISFTTQELSVIPNSWHVESDWHSI